MDIENEVELIKERNKKVEVDKAWEISWFRALLISSFIYVIAAVWLVLIHDTYPWLKAFVPAGGYLLSTLSLPYVKNWWLQKIKK